MKHKYQMIAVFIISAVLTIVLVGCVHNHTVSTNTAVNWNHTLQTIANQKENTTEKLWQLQNQKTIAINQSDYKTLSKLKQPLFSAQNKLNYLTNKMANLNKIYRARDHHAVLDDGTVINTNTLLKTRKYDSHHLRAHILINKLRKLQKQQMQINEQLWDDQNKITIDLNHNDMNAINQIKSKYFADRKKALPIMNKIEMLSEQIVKFTGSLQHPNANIQSTTTFNDWIVYQTVLRNNNQMTQSITPSDPNNDVSSHTTINDDDDNTHVSTGTTPSADDSGTHVGSESNAAGHTSGDASGHAGSSESGGGGHAGGEGGGGGR